MLICIFAFSVSSSISSYQCKAQKIQLTIPKSIIALNEPLEVILTLENLSSSSEIQFPELTGFKKRNQMRFERKEFAGGIEKTIQTIQQNYLANAEGLIEIPHLKVWVDKQPIEHTATKILVLPFDEKKQYSSENIFEQLVYSEEDKNFIEVQEDAFLGLFANKEEIFVGEGVTIVLAFYVATTNQAYMDFVEVSKQLTEISKQLKPAHCWEEVFDIQQIKEDSSKNYFNNKQYKRYKLFQATYYPLNAQAIDFPSISLKMIKYKVRSKGVENEQDKKPDFKTFYTNPKKIKVKPLPPHVLSSQVPVGVLYLQEEYPQKVLQTGEKFSYKIIISGEANFNTLPSPEYIPNQYLDFFSPQSQLFSQYAESGIFHTKVFTYNILPKKAGTYYLQNHFQFVYYNVLTQKYDTLKPRATIKVVGETILNNQNNEQSIYQNISQVSTQEYAWGFRREQAFYMQIFIAIVFFIALMLFFFKAD